MAPIVILAVLIGLVALATLLGVVWRLTSGRVRQGSGDVVRLSEVRLAGRATLLQFSTDVCAPCKATHRVLHRLANDFPDVEHVDLDLTNRPELASQFNILQTPTTFVLDHRGVIRARIGGAVRRDVIVAELDRVLESSHNPASAAA